jgi:hypothetical protein
MNWKTLNTKIIEANEHLRFLVDEFETEKGKKGKYYYHSCGSGDDFVGVVVQKDVDTFIMTREYRYLFDRISLAFPKGAIEPNETIEEAAIRETIEECGYKPNTLIPIGWVASAPAISKEKMRLFLGKDIVKVENQKQDELETITAHKMTSKQIDEAIMSGEMWDGGAISGWLKVKLFLGI